jgi:subtilisin family serine protease
MRVVRWSGLLVLLCLSTPARSDPSRELILRLAPGAQEAFRARLARSRLREAGSLADRLPLATSITAELGFGAGRVLRLEAEDHAAAEAALATLALDPLVQWVEPNRTREAALENLPNDPLLRSGRQWGLHDPEARNDVRVLEAWRTGVGANTMLLAIADTGADPGQPDLGGAMPDGRTRLVHGVNVTGEAPSAWGDSVGHGTAVAGVMAARTNDGAHFDSLGVAGVCGGDGRANAGCRIVPIKISPGHLGTASAFDIACAILHATAVGARAMNLSFAGGGPSRLEREALAFAIARGCVVVAAAGNRGAVDGAAPQYPAAYAAEGLCIQVGACDRMGERAAFSSFGPGLDLLAPGVDIWTTSLTYRNAYGAQWPGVALGSGTSLAAPFVTGAVGLLAAARPELIDADFQNVLRGTARDLGAAGPDRETGWGRLDLERALEAVRPEVGIWHDEIAAQSFRPAGEDTLAIDGGGPGALEGLGGRHPALRIEALATIAVPDSFLAVERVWPRVGGTMSARGTFRLDPFAPWAEVVARDARTITLRGYLYRILGADGDDDGVAPEMPVPIDQVRFGFTVLGPVRRPPAAAAPVRPPAQVLTAAPNPFTNSVRISGPGPRVVIFDVNGRRVRQLTLGGPEGSARWDGRDARGRRVPAGLYFVRAGHGAVMRVCRLVALE